MSTYTDQVMSALTAFDATLATFGALVRTRPSSATVLRKDLDRLADWANRAGAASSRLRFSSNIIVDTAVDIVDFQVRLQGEAAALASALGGLAGVLEKQTAIRDAFDELPPRARTKPTPSCLSTCPCLTAGAVRRRC
jgi:hypothetical protein